MSPAAGIAPCGRQGHIYPTMSVQISADDLERKEAQGISTYGINVFLRDIPVFENRQIGAISLASGVTYSERLLVGKICTEAPDMMISPPMGHVSRRSLLELNFSCSPTGLIIAS